MKSNFRSTMILTAVVPPLLAGCVTQRPAFVIRGGTEQVQTSAPIPTEARVIAAPSSLPAYDGLTTPVTVREGDTLAAIAQRTGTSVTLLESINHVDRRQPLYPGQVLLAPSSRLAKAGGPVMRAPQPAYRAEPAFPLVSPNAPRELHPEIAGQSGFPMPTAKLAFTPRPLPRPVAPERAADISTPVPAQTAALRSPGRFLWPVQGSVIMGFGPGPRGERNDGIDIAVSDGTPVRAAADGTVSYVGNELKGYGNLLLIRHGGDYVTTYAHLKSVRVERGDRVEQGQIIATTGSTGDVERPQLHFEIRHGVEPVDPRPLLTPGGAS
jgi:murein DD-endopeptidase MepM/ murein hydrolase activator NlpD